MERELIRVKQVTVSKNLLKKPYFMLVGGKVRYGSEETAQAAADRINGRA